MEDTERDLYVKDLMRIYSRTVGTIYNWIKAGIPHEKKLEGRQKVYKFNRAEVDAWLEANGRE